MIYLHCWMTTVSPVCETAEDEPRFLGRRMPAQRTCNRLIVPVARRAPDHQHRLNLTTQPRMLQSLGKLANTKNMPISTERSSRTYPRSVSLARLLSIPSIIVLHPRAERWLCTTSTFIHHVGKFFGRRVCPDGNVAQSFFLKKF